MTLAAYFGWDDATLAAARAKADQIQTQRVTKDCMRAKGFDYESQIVDIPALPGFELSPADFADMYGFGIVKAPPPGSAIEDDPNQQVVASLHPTEQRPFVEALYTHPRYGRYGGGCMGRAILEVHGRRDAALAPLRRRMEVLAEVISHDSRVRDAERAWVDCMQPANIAVNRREHLLDRVTREIALRHARIRGDDPDALDELFLREREIAVAVVECDRALFATQALVAAEVESAFIAANRELLEQIRAEAYP